MNKSIFISLFVSIKLLFFYTHFSMSVHINSNQLPRHMKNIVLQSYLCWIHDQQTNLVRRITRAFASKEHHGVQQSGCMDNEPEPSRSVSCLGPPWFTDQFRLDHTQTCTPGRRWDLMSSVFWPCIVEVFRHAMNPTGLFP